MGGIGTLKRLIGKLAKLANYIVSLLLREGRGGRTGEKGKGGEGTYF